MHYLRTFAICQHILAAQSASPKDAGYNKDQTVLDCWRVQEACRRVQMHKWRPLEKDVAADEKNHANWLFWVKQGWADAGRLEP